MRLHYGSPIPSSAPSSARAASPQTLTGQRRRSYWTDAPSLLMQPSVRAQSSIHSHHILTLSLGRASGRPVKELIVCWVKSSSGWYTEIHLQIHTCVHTVEAKSFNPHCILVALVKYTNQQMSAITKLNMDGRKYLPLNSIPPNGTQSWIRRCWNTVPTFSSRGLVCLSARATCSCTRTTQEEMALNGPQAAEALDRRETVPGLSDTPRVQQIVAAKEPLQSSGYTFHCGLQWGQ